MGDPRKHRRKYAGPKKPWDSARLEEEKAIVKEYGTSNKKEIYKMRSTLKKFSLQAKKLMSASSQQSGIERKALLSKLHSLALVNADSPLDDVLALQLKNVMERRLQTLVYRKGFANTIKQARQFIVHRHIKVGSKPITSHSYLVSKDEEHKITFIEKSSLANPEHPERPEQIHKLKESLKKAKSAPVKVAAPEESKAEAPTEVTQ